MANCHDPIAAWDWDSVLAFSDTPPFLLEQDNSLSQWHSDPVEYSSSPGVIDGLARQAAVNCSPGQPDTSGLMVSGKDSVNAASDFHESSQIRDSSVTTTFPSPESHEMQPSHLDRVRKKDPRLSCPNFLAGLVPCSCPEVDGTGDDATEEITRKRAKVAARCQVPSCRADISHLKGYHQRHRVCLDCANSSEVILNDQPHRYCQQCGKFHLLSDFDEGKRSCRRKLEKHNDRRRRKPLETGEAVGKESTILSSDKENHSIGSHKDVPGNSGEAKLYSPFGSEQSVAAGETLGKQMMETEQPCQASDKSVEQVLIRSEGAETNAASTLEVTGMYSLTSSSAGIEGAESYDAARLQSPELLPNEQFAHSPLRSCRRENHSISPYSQETHAFASEGTSRQNLQSAFREEIRASETSSIVPAEFRQENLGSNSSGVDEQSLLALLIDDITEGDGLPCSVKSARQHQMSDFDVLGSSLSSSAYKKKCVYTSPCPTGRVSFKLFDWNPADFPRRLRQQIFEWLANMPVELEGYIRPGCTILTFFMTMPQSMWNKLDDDWMGYVLRLLGGLHHHFWGGGYIIARLNNKVMHFQNGKVLSGNFKEESAPILHDVFPLCVEAGCTSDIVIHGDNLFRTKSRFLVSFRELYLECLACELVECCQKVGQMSLEGSETCKITIGTHDSGKYGPAYVEVDHDLGVSNFIPILIADKEVCAEVNSLWQSLEVKTTDHDKKFQSNAFGTCNPDILKRQMVSDLLVDLGLVLMHLQEENPVYTLKRHDALILRLQRLLSFSITNGCYVVVKRLLQTAEITGVMPKLGLVGPHGLNVLQMVVPVKHWNNSLNEQRVTSNRDSTGSECLWNDNMLVSTNLLPLSNKASAGGDDYIFDPYKHAQNAHIMLDDQFTVGKNISAMLYSSLKKSSDAEPETHTFQQLNLKDCMTVPMLEESTPSIKKELQTWNSRAQRLQCFRKPMRTIRNINFYANYERGAMRRFLITVLSVVTVCAGMCLVLQHPHQVAEMSLSLRRCLGGSTDAAARV